MPLNLRHLTLLLLIALAFACRRSGENLPEPNYNPYALKPGNYIEARPRVIPPDSLPKPIYVSAKGTYIKAGKPTYVPADDNYVPAGRPKYTPTQGRVIEMDSSFQLEFLPAVVEKIPSPWPKWEAAPPPFPITGTYPLTYLGVEHGLDFQTVRCLLEDNFGRIWIGTDHGLSVWDGVGFIHFTTKEGLLSNAIFSLLEDQFENIWIGTGKGLNVWDGHGIIDFADNGGPAVKIGSLLEDSSGNIWIGGSDFRKPNNKNLWIWDGAGFSRFPESEKIPDMSVIHDLLQDRRGNIWMNVSVWDGKRFINFSEKEGLGSDAIRCMLEDRQGNILIGAYSGGISIWNGSGITHYSQSEGLSHNHVWSLLEDEDGKIWMGTIGGGVSIWDGKGFTRYARSEKVSDSSVRSLLQDRFGKIWMGTDKGSLTIWDKTGIFNYFQQPGSRVDPVRSNCILEDQEGKLWIGTTGNGLNVWDGHGFYQYSEKQGLRNKTINALLEDREGRIWIGGTDLSIWDGTGFTHFSLADINGDYVTTLAEDSRGHIWIGTNTGLSVWDGNGFSNYDFDALVKMNISAHAGLKLLQDHNGDIWITSTGGISCFGKDGFLQIDLPGESSSNWMRSLEEDAFGNIWMGTMANGIWVWDGRGLVHFTKEQGLSFNSISSLCADGQGNVWAGTYGGGGLMHISKEQEGFAIESISISKGQAATTYYDIATYQENNLWLATDKGLEVMMVKSDSTHPSILLREIQPFFDLIDWRQLQDTVGKGGTPTTGEAQIPLAKVTYDSVYRFTNLPAAPGFPYNINQLTLHWNGLNALQPNQLQYSCFLEGRGRSWSPPIRENQITFQDLRPGKYIFKVRAVSGTGRWSDTATYAFTIRPPWFWAWWSQSLYLLLLLGGAYGLYRFQLNRRLAQAETARLREMDEVKTRLFTNITHEFRTPLTVVLGMEERIRQEPFGRLSESLQMIRRNGHILLRLVNQLLGLARLESNVLPFHPVQADIMPYLQYIVGSFRSYAETKNIQLHFQSETESLVMDYDPDIVLQIVSNLLSNAVKFTAAGGNIRLAAKIRRSELLELRVQDNGVGIPAKKLAHIFDRFYQASPSPSNGAEEKGYTHKGVGIGLALTRELVHLLGGQIEVKSTVDKGTEFTIQLPIRREAAPAVEVPGAREKVKEEMLAFMVPDQSDDLAAVPAAASADVPLILIVEDNADVSKYLIASLEEDYQIETAADGRAGIEKALEIVPDLIISDVIMPEKDGFELCYALKSDPATSHIPIVLLTARADIDSKITGLRQGADAYLAKPFYEEELKVQLGNLLALRRKLQAYYSSADYHSGQAPEGNHPAESLEDEFLRQLRQAVEANLEDYNLDVTKLCRVLGVSRTVLHNKLKALTGQSTTEYMRFIRLHKAGELLHNTQLNISQIAYEVGFRNPTYFTKMFGELFGCSPMEYRERGGK